MLDEPATSRQVNVLQQILPPHQQWMLNGLTKQRASLLIKENYAAWASLPATIGQENYLRDISQWKGGLKRGEAALDIAAHKAGY
jgi:hypothetical protein